VRGDRDKLEERLAAQRPLETSASYRPIVLPKSEDWAANKAKVLGVFNKRLQQAWPDRTPTKFFFIVAVFAFLFFAAAMYVTGSAMAGVIGAAMGASIPFMMMNARRMKRAKRIDDQLPDALDFLTRILRAGHSLATAFQMAGEELPEPLGPEFSRCHAQHSLGQPLEESLKDMAQRVDVPDFSFCVTAIMIQRQTGGDLAEVLKNIGGMVRARIRLQQHVRAITAEGRLVGRILLGLPVVFFCVLYVINPKYAQVLLNTPEGRWLSATAVLLQVLGMLTIRKIVAVKL